MHLATHKLRMLVATLLLAGCVANTTSVAEKPNVAVQALTQEPWQEAVVSVSSLERSSAFFLEIGGYNIRWQGALDSSVIKSWGLPSSASGEAMLLAHEDASQGLVRLVRFDNAGRKEPTRPGGHAWDTGCYFSLMVRMKDMQAIYDDAVAMGWWNETPITYLEFGQSRLNVMIFKGPDGLQVQGYERLAPALPEAVGDFDRITRPFNIMQMVRSRDAAYEFFTEILGFDTFYAGKPYIAPTPAHSPIGIPINLTTSAQYHAGIVFPVPGEFGRMEAIEIIGIDGYDFSSRCDAPNLGILAVRFEVDDAVKTRETLLSRGWQVDREPEAVSLSPYGNIRLLAIKTPDGAIVQFFSRND